MSCWRRRCELERCDEAGGIVGRVLCGGRTVSNVFIVHDCNGARWGVGVGSLARAGTGLGGSRVEV